MKQRWGMCCGKPDDGSSEGKTSVSGVGELTDPDVTNGDVGDQVGQPPEGLTQVDEVDETTGSRSPSRSQEARSTLADQLISPAEVTNVAASALASGSEGALTSAVRSILRRARLLAWSLSQEVTVEHLVIAMSFEGGDVEAEVREMFERHAGEMEVVREQCLVQLAHIKPSTFDSGVQPDNVRLSQRASGLLHAAEGIAEKRERELRAVSVADVCDALFGAGGKRTLDFQHQDAGLSSSELHEIRNRLGSIETMVNKIASARKGIWSSLRTKLFGR